MDKKTIQIQVALFFSKKFLDSFEKASFSLKEALGNDLETQYLPVPVEFANDEIPGLMIRYDNFNIHFSRSRIDVFFKDEETLTSKANKIIEVVMNNLGLKIGRIGLVKTFFLKKDSSYLKTFLSADKISGKELKDIVIRVNQALSIMNFTFNSSQQMQEAKVSNKETQEQGIVIVRDINSVVEDIETNDFKNQQLIELVEKLNIEAGKFILE